MLRKIKTITSHVGLSRWLAETAENPAGYLARCQVEDIRSPYSYGPTKAILDWNGRQVVYFETSHRRYEVFEVPTDLLRFKSDDDAMAWNTRYCRKNIHLAPGQPMFGPGSPNARY